MKLFLIFFATTASHLARAQQQSTAQYSDKLRGGRSKSKSTLHAEKEQPCGLWFAESTHEKGTVGIFTGVDVDSGATVGEPDIDIPIFDTNLNEWSPWHDIAWNGDVEDDLMLQNLWQTKSILPGLGSNVICTTSDMGNIYHPHGESVDSTGVHRSKDPSVGSFSYRHNISFATTRHLEAGEELFTTCHYTDQKENVDDIVRTNKRPVEWLESNAICIDSLSIKTSTIPNIGRGAFSKRNVKKGEAIVSSPVLQFDRSETQIVEQFINKEGRLEYTDHVQQHQLLLNYCFGHADSNILLLPYGPGVSFINHHKKPNAKIVWSESEFSDDSSLRLIPSKAIARRNVLLVDYVATRDIKPGEEIFIDYGSDWQQAWENHVKTWEPPTDSDKYVSAADFKKKFDKLPIRTVEEQKYSPYPDNIHTACLFRENIEESDLDGFNDYYSIPAPVFWNEKNEDCLRPCNIIERQALRDEYYYTIEMEEMSNQLAPAYCDLSHERQVVLKVPERMITVVDKEYTADQLLTQTFRNEIGVPEGFYPHIWMAEDQESDTGDVLRHDLEVGQMEPMRWKENGQVVTRNAYLLGLSHKVRQSLLDYSNRMGITERFRTLTSKGNGLRPSKNEKANLNGLDWFIQRPDKKWKSDMHWISPFDEHAHEDYLRALSAAGFDDVLQQIGNHLGLEHLTCYHVTFIAVSHCTRGFVHYDVTNTGAKVFNVIIPLILAKSSGPELELRGDDNKGKLRYQYDVASLMGDDAYHGTAAVDYRNEKEMRMAATVYIAEITTDNINAIMDDYTQHYPPADRPDILLGMAGDHWRRNDPSVKLPKPLSHSKDGKRNEDDKSLKRCSKK